MSIAAQTAKHFREVYYGGNWTWSNLKDQLTGVTWEQATTKVHSFNTIAALTYHIHYYVTAATNVLKGQPLEAHDKYSFDHPPVHSEEDWNALLNKMWMEADVFATLVEHLPDDVMEQTFAAEKYGIYFRNLHGIIEHTHYHLGQIALIKKLVQQGGQAASNPL